LSPENNDKGMDSSVTQLFSYSVILILGGSGFLMLIIVVALRAYYQKVIKTKERGIVHHLREQDKLAKELECIHAEKRIREKILESKFEEVVMLMDKKEKSNYNNV
jgi:hypothetical protein